MSVVKIDEHIFMVDVEAAGIRNFVSSYIINCEGAVIIETGPTSSIQNLVNGLSELGIEPEDISYVVVSHIHLDHAGGVGTLIKHLPKAKVLVHQRGVPHLANPEKLWQQSKMTLGTIAEIYGRPEPVPLERMVAAYDGMILNIGEGIALKAVETLGHASHHLSYYEPLSKGIFTGDAAGIYVNELDVIVPTTPPPFRMDIALRSLDKLASLRPLVLYYTHFGKALNGAEKIEIYIKQLKLWAKTAKFALDAGEDLGAISRRIIENDNAVKRAEGYIRAHKVLRETVLKESVLGIIDFVKNFGAPV